MQKGCPEAIAVLRGGQIEPDDPVAHVDLGVVLVEQKGMMRPYTTEGHSSNPQYDNAHYNLGVLLAYNNRFEEAIGSYMQALRINPEKKGAHANIGAALLHLGKFDEAIVNFQEELKIDPGNQAVRNYLSAAIDMKNAGARKF
jgi:tetratricopeptide (TPR) repeat protein